jgi:hypothetical protein
VTLKYTVDSTEINVIETDYDKASRIVLNLFRLIVQQRIIVVTVLKLVSPKPEKKLNDSTLVLLILSFLLWSIAKRNSCRIFVYVLTSSYVQYFSMSYI